ncbi:hypothetical protein MNBD_GAMMA20-1460, partial [hydrothermal vent metagenome]
MTHNGESFADDARFTGSLRESIYREIQWAKSDKWSRDKVSQ